MATFRFGQHIIKSSAVFLQTELSYALVNRKPVVPGRILLRFFVSKNRYNSFSQAYSGKQCTEKYSRFLRLLSNSLLFVKLV